MNNHLHIIGHGIAGTSLAMMAYQHNTPFTLYGASMPGEASWVSSGLIAPVTGRRYVKAWNIDEYLSSAVSFYRWTESVLKETFFHPVEIVRFLMHDEALRAWHKRINVPEYEAYISEKQYPELSSFGRPYGIVTGGYRLDSSGWLKACHAVLEREGKLIRQVVTTGQANELEGNVIWSTGAINAFLPKDIIPNKGEALLVRMPDWRLNVIIKDEIFIIPIGDDLYWAGSHYEPWPEHAERTSEGRERIMAILQKWHTGQTEIVEHLTGIRPTVDDRRPLIGPLSEHQSQYIFNGMGTKGTSLAPFWANELLRHIMDGHPLAGEVLPQRFSG